MGGEQLIKLLKVNFEQNTCDGEYIKKSCLLFPFGYSGYHWIYFLDEDGKGFGGSYSTPEDAMKALYGYGFHNIKFEEVELEAHTVRPIAPPNVRHVIVYRSMLYAGMRSGVPSFIPDRKSAERLAYKFSDAETAANRVLELGLSGEAHVECR